MFRKEEKMKSSKKNDCVEQRSWIETGLEEREIICKKKWRKKYKPGTPPQAGQKEREAWGDTRKGNGVTAQSFPGKRTEQAPSAAGLLSVSLLGLSHL